MKTIKSMLQVHAFTEGMEGEHVQKLADCASPIEIPGGQYIFRQGESADYFYLLIDGSADIELFSASGGPVVLQKIGPGSVLGWSWLVSPYRWRFDARTVEKVTALKIDVVKLRNLMETDSQFGFEILQRFLQIVGERLESERIKLLDVYASHS
jgi:CRP-like cAMP-binding protein